MSNFYAVIGGGLAGLLCARKLAERGESFYLIDSPINHLGRRLGGFAEFSGAKFSKLPAGGGLIPVAGSMLRLTQAIEEVIKILELDRFPCVTNNDANLNSYTDLQLRGYKSYLLTPTEINSLIQETTCQLPKESLIFRSAISVSEDNGLWTVQLDDGSTLSAGKVIMAGGRMGAAILERAGALPQAGRGVDLGIRIEFNSQEPLRNLRALGADAKIIYKRCRTFCLNSPGQIFHYPFSQNLLIPGGIVAHEISQASNVGILFRSDQKERSLLKIKEAANSLPGPLKSLKYRAPNYRSVVDQKLLQTYFDSEAIEALTAFVDALNDARLIDFEGGCTVYYPLIDWYWPIFGTTSTFETTKAGLYVVGDLAGHARGLLQAAVSGWLAGKQI
ncbi:hypothetical protein [uncultured Pseudacidovorax sp.]|uniref:hypothetical protein n=1 Tax=uncultured Pseudacidovorax sp. TaxID=679313 RepID=UPI0025ECEB85|nr:hypothetical protein [uncultured Pseudacidovorax sp.]